MVKEGKMIKNKRWNKIDGLRDNSFRKNKRTSKYSAFLRNDKKLNRKFNKLWNDLWINREWLIFKRYVYEIKWELNSIYILLTGWCNLLCAFLGDFS